MDGSESDLRHETKPLSVNNQQGHSTSIRLKVPPRNPAMHSRVISQSTVGCNGDDVEEKETSGDKVEKVGGVRIIGKDNYDDVDEDDVSDDEDDEETAEEDNNNDGNDGIGLPQKKRKMKDSVSNYELVPRVRTPPAHVAAKSETSSVGRGIGANWTERESFALLDAWGDRFLKLGRKSLSSDDWREVSDKVSRETNVERTDSQCRNRLDVLKKRYKKEKASGGDASNWIFFRRMDFLLNSPAQQRPSSSLSCGVDSGGYVFVNPKVYLNRANGLDEMKDSPENSESSKNDQDDSLNKVVPEGNRKRGRKSEGSCFQLLADSIQKFSDIYEDIEISRRKQMVDIENMRMDFQRQIETQTRQILERAQAEIMNLRQQGGDADENGASGENCSER